MSYDAHTSQGKGQAKMDAITNQIHILLIEDNPNDIELTLHTLEKQRLTKHLKILHDGAEALDYIFCKGTYTERDITDCPKLILLDIKLPKIDGLQVLKQIKSDPRTRNIPTVMLTSSNQETDIWTSYQSGANSYITKPVDFTQFKQTVENLGLYWLTLNQPPPPLPSAN